MRQLQAENEADRAALDRDVIAQREELNAAEETARQRRAERDRLIARQELLARLRQELTGYYPGVREVLAGGNGLRGLMGTVASLMDVPAELEQAIESAMGPRLQHIVAERWEDAEMAIAHLKQTRAGWATFLPLDTLRTRPALALQAQAGVHGVASRLVRYDARLQPVFDLLLGTTVIVDDLPTARRLLNQRGISLIVTLDGETVQPSGALSGGARHQGANLLAQEREWRDLPGRVEAAEGELDTALQSYAARQAALQEAQRALAEADRRQQTLRAEREAARTAVNQHAQNARELARERQWRASLFAQMQKEQDELAGREQATQAKLDQVQQEQLDVTAQLRETRQRLDATQNDGLRQRLAELETRAGMAQRTLQSQRALLSSHRSSLAQLEQQAAAKAAQREQLLRDIAGLQAQQAAGDERQQAVDARLAELAAQLEPLRQQMAELQEQQREMERQRVAGQERLNEAELAHSRALLERDHANDEQLALARDIEDELGPVHLPEMIAQQLRLALGDDVVELPTVTMLPAGLSNEIRDLKARLRRLGNINLDAPREYEQVLDRETFLQGQDADLRGAIGSLHEVIAELDTRIDSEFSATFKAVTAAFAEYFQTLFAGGHARLLLTDPSAISSTGVDIMVQLPGKRTESLALLSGGERALTAVALLFALLKANPVPFCFLDEVDAALDESNVRRFRQVLGEHAKSTQFVVITHNRHTMEAATTLYGISMAEQGVSQCVSLQLERDAERLRSLQVE